MRRLTLTAFAILLAGCSRPDPALAPFRAQAAQEARAMIGKEYIFVAPARVCRDQSDVYESGLYASRVLGSSCRTVGTGRFRVEAAAATKDGRTLLRIAGPDIAGYLPYEVYLPKPYRDVADFFPTGK